MNTTLQGAARVSALSFPPARLPGDFPATRNRVAVRPGAKSNLKQTETSQRSACGMPAEQVRYPWSPFGAENTGIKGLGRCNASELSETIGNQEEQSKSSFGGARRPETLLKTAQIRAASLRPNPLRKSLRNRPKTA